MYMKQTKLFVMSAMVLLGIGQGSAQTYTGTTPDAAVSATGDEATVYLYNVGKSQWLSRGGIWGTEAILGDIPVPFTVKSGSGDNSYKLLANYTDQYGNASTTSFMTAALYNMGNVAFDLHLDQNDDTYSNLTFTPGTGNQYQISSVVSADVTFTVQTKTATGVSKTVSAGTYYMVAGYNSESTDEADDGTNINMISDLTSFTNGEDKWLLVTKKELEDKFQDVDASESAPALATFLITCPDFARADQAINAWKESDGTGLSEYSRSWTGTPESQTVTYYNGIGMGTGFPNQGLYGGQFSAYIKGSGKLSQDITAIRAGWYAVSVNAFSTAEGAAKFYASVGSSTTATTYQTPYAEATVTAVTGDAVPTTYVKADSLVNGGGYRYSILVYVSQANSTMTIGMDASSQGSDIWTCIDNFELYYLGDPKNVVLLDEDEITVNYINNQNAKLQHHSDNSYARSTVYLHRKLNQNSWNSLVLPFTIDRDVINSVFGSGTIVSELKGAKDADHANRIYFEAVDKMTAGRLYIIKPTSANPTIADAVESSAKDDANKAIKTFAANTDNCWTFGSVSFGQTDGYKAEVEDATYNGDETYGSDTKVYFVGTYVSDKASLSSEDANYEADDKQIPAKSYVLAGNTASKHTAGLWYYRTNTTKSKGFRGWLQTTDPSATVEMVINGVVEVHNGSTTGIEGLTEDPTVQTKVSGVYNLNGQLVRKGSSVEGLGQGIYIVNGRKYVVR